MCVRFFFTGSKIKRICNNLKEKLNPLRWLYNDISESRERLKWTIELYRDVRLDGWTSKPRILSDEHPALLPQQGTRALGLVGLDSSVETLSGLLADNEGGIRGKLKKVVAIAGMAGVGKTTLAKELYSKLRGQFECCAFVWASRWPDMRKLLTDLLLQVRRHQPVDAYEVTDLIDKIRAHLRCRKYASSSFLYARLLHVYTHNSSVLPFHPLFDNDNSSSLRTPFYTT